MLAILTTHPIQNQVPIWRELARRGEVEFEVWYLSDQGVRRYLDPDFGHDVQWDVPLLEGYPFRFLSTEPEQADLTHFRGARARDVGKLLDERRISALWITGWYLQAYLQAAFLARRRRIPVWLRAESNDLARPSRRVRAQRAAMLRLLFRQVDRFLYIGSANRRLYRAFGVPEEKLVPAPYCVENERFTAASRLPASELRARRDRWGIASDAVCFLFSGKLIAKKRALDLLQAAIMTVEREPEYRNRLHLLIVGAGELLAELERAADMLSSLCGRPTVTFAGFLNQSEMASAYAVADWLVLPSDARETWGLVVNEALASGTPCLVSDQCGCAEDLAAPLDPRLVFPAGDVEGLATRIEDVLSGRIPTPSPDVCRALVAGHDVGMTVDSVTAAFRELTSRERTA